jgi:Domain of unknown function (DUF4352)
VSLDKRLREGVDRLASEVDPDVYGNLGRAMRGARSFRTRRYACMAGAIILLGTLALGTKIITNPAPSGSVGKPGSRNGVAPSTWPGRIRLRMGGIQRYRRIGRTTYTWGPHGRSTGFDGSFTFIPTYQGRMSQERCHWTTLGGGATTTVEAHGVFCIFDVTVHNMGTRAEVIDSNQFLLTADTEGYLHSHSLATAAMNALGEPNLPWWKGNLLNRRIKPGETARGTLLFDIPKHETWQVIELHKSRFSTGVRIDVNLLRQSAHPMGKRCDLPVVRYSQWSPCA